LLTQPLGLEGWAHLEAPILAALATHEPLLLIGPHGTAKSFLLERLAQALGLEYRFYNASLLNYDDLVGIPVPDAKLETLRYISVPTAVWDAEVVFIDEINRTRPDLQNKLFPLIHEKRVQGISLTKLRYRWAAMNPPPRDDDPDGSDNYLGAEPLDPALADRFSFIIEVPDWESLSDTEKRNVLLDQFRGRHEFAVPIADLVERARRLYLGFQENTPSELTEYVISLSAQRSASGQRTSPRRNSNLLRNVLALQASRVVLRQAVDSTAPASGVDWESSAWLAVRHSQPSLAETGRLDASGLLAAHKQAWKLAGLDASDPWRSLLKIGNLVDRFIAAVRLRVELDDVDVGQLVLDAQSSINIPAHRTAFALAAYLSVHEDRDVPATVVETLAGEVRRVLEPVERKLMVPGGQIGDSREVGNICSQLVTGLSLPDHRRDAFTRNLLQALLPDGYGGTTPAAVQHQFETWWARLSLDNGPAAEEDR
jgi:MoxR-like ATPase